MPVDIRRRYIGSCHTFDAENKTHDFDITLFIIRMLLFDTFILQSNRLDEFEPLFKMFGYGGIKEILSSGAIRIHDQAHAVGQTGQTGLGFRGKKKDGTPRNLLPLNSYSFDIIKHANENEIMHKNMQKIHAISGLKQKEAIKLKGLIASNLVRYPQESTKNILNQTISDFGNNTPNLRKAINLSIISVLNVGNSHIEDISYVIEVDDENDVHVNSNISQILNIDEMTCHKIMEKSLLAVGSLNKRIETMRAFSAVSGFRENELSIFEDKLDFIRNVISPDVREANLRKIMSWPFFPSIEDAIKNGSLKIDTLLKIRETPECIEFRSWLWDSDDHEIEELKARIDSLSSRLAIKLSSKTSKALRWVTTLAVGLLPGVGLVAGPALGLLDTFLLEKLIKRPGASTFLGEQYPSIFKNS